MPEASRKSLICWIATGVVLAGLLSAWLFGPWRSSEWNHSDVVIPDEKAAAFELLAGKFSGPRYFHGTNAHTISSDATADFSINIGDVRSQVDRIAHERRFEAVDVTNLDKLIDRLTEPPKSRVVGDPQVNLLRLNLALDALVESNRLNQP